MYRDFYTLIWKEFNRLFAQLERDVLEKVIEGKSAELEEKQE